MLRFWFNVRFNWFERDYESAKKREKKMKWKR